MKIKVEVVLHSFQDYEYQSRLSHRSWGLVRVLAEIFNEAFSLVLKLRIEIRKNRNWGEVRLYENIVFVYFIWFPNAIINVTINVRIENIIIEDLVENLVDFLNNRRRCLMKMIEQFKSVWYHAIWSCILFFLLSLANMLLKFTREYDCTRNFWRNPVGYT